MIPHNACEALVWWVEKQGVANHRICVGEGNVVQTDLPTFKLIVGDGIVKITEWEVPGIAMPSDDKINNEIIPAFEESKIE